MPRQLAQLEAVTVGRARTFDLDHPFGREETKREWRAGLLVADEREGELVDGDSEILEIADRESGAGSGVGGCQSREPQVHGMAGNRERDRSVSLDPLAPSITHDHRAGSDRVMLPTGSIHHCEWSGDGAAGQERFDLARGKAPFGERDARIRPRRDRPARSRPACG